MPCTPADLTEVNLFQLLDDAELSELASVIDSKKVAAGETIFRAGDLGDCLYIVGSGEVELSIKDKVGEKVVLAAVGQNEIFGELSMLDARPRSASAIALRDTELLMLDRGDLLLLFKKQPDAALNMLAVLSGMLRKVDRLVQTRVTKNVNEEMEEKLSLLQRISDWIVWFSGSMQFLLVHTIWFIFWIGTNVLGPERNQFDPYPFGLLTMIVSLEAIFLSVFVLISQNRQAAKDKIRADVEYEVNIKAELEIAHLHDKVDDIFEDMTTKLGEVERLLRKERS